MKLCRECGYSTVREDQDFCEDCQEAILDHDPLRSNLPSLSPQNIKQQSKIHSSETLVTGCVLTSQLSKGNGNQSLGARLFRSSLQNSYFSFKTKIYHLTLRTETGTAYILLTGDLNRPMELIEGHELEIEGIWTRDNQFAGKRVYDKTTGVSVKVKVYSPNFARLLLLLILLIICGVVAIYATFFSNPLPAAIMVFVLLMLLFTNKKVK